MQIGTKIPVTKTEVAEIMGVDKTALDVWDSFEEMRSHLKDYNFGVLPKLELIKKLRAISRESINNNEFFMSAGVEKLIQKVIALY